MSQPVPVDGAKFNPHQYGKKRWSMYQCRAGAAAISALVLLAACAAPPMGPTVGVMPAPNKPFEAFQADQAACQQYAGQQAVDGVGKRCGVKTIAGDPSGPFTAVVWEKTAMTPGRLRTAVEPAMGHS